MKLHISLAALLLAAASSLPVGAYAAENTDTAKPPAEAPAVTKGKPHSHMEEKMGMMPQKSAPAAPESNKKVAKAKSDKARHLHPRDGK